MIKNSIRIGALLLALVGASVLAEQSRPNIIYILMDDLGYGDVQILNPERGKIATPKMDQIAQEGMIFTDAHTSSSVCTPSRYSILTGRYNWRTTLQKSVLYGYDLPMIAKDRLTVAGLLQENGYATACIGKWHLGLGFPTTDGEPVDPQDPTNVDWHGRIEGGPVDLGFDYFYGIASSLNIPPYIYMENDRFVGEATTVKEFGRKGLAQADFEAEETLDIIVEKTVEFIDRQDSSKPFFAYVPFTSPHTPILPTEEWRGRSEVGQYGDFVMQTDAAVGAILEAVEAAGFGDNTIFIVTSDNGCSKWANIDEMLEKGHYPSAQFRGSKADLWEGGHRVPFLVRWPAEIEAGTQSDQAICLSDLMATCADLLSLEVPETAAEDSVSFLPAFQGEPIVSTRAGIIHHSFSGHFAYRQGKWKLLLAKSSGGWTAPAESRMPEGSPIAQLYDMEQDPGETTNLYADRPEIVETLLAQLKSDVARGRSTEGMDTMNDIDDIVLWKSGK